MDGKGSYSDNLFIERLWRTVKYEEVYLKAYLDGKEARAGIGEYFRFYNTQRPHQALGNRTPAEVYDDLVESVSRSVIESLEPITTRKAEPALDRVPILSYYWVPPQCRNGLITFTILGYESTQGISELQMRDLVTGLALALQ
jgi:putative transposase